MLEHCRACRDEFDEMVPAEFIIWGKLTPREHLGPRCYHHTAEFVGSTGMSQIDQWAIFDLRPFMAVESGGSSAPSGVTPND